MFVIKENRLTVMTVSMAPRASSDSKTARADVEVRFQQGDEVIRLLRVGAEQFGLPESSQDASRFRLNEPDFHLDQGVVDVLRNLVSELEPGSPLWLHVALPNGNLAMVPWERLLHSEFPSLPVVRVPFFVVQPVPAEDSLDVVICASSPLAKPPFNLASELRQLIMRISTSAARPPVVHVFSDQGAYEELQAEFAAMSGVRLYDPRKWSSWNASLEREAGAIESPWLLWILETLATRSVDIVHFLGHGFLSADQGMLAFAESPLVNQDQETARFIGARQISKFLTLAGAWALAFTAPHPNYSILALRALVDRVARLRAGPVLLHDRKEDPDYEQLSQGYRFLFTATRVDRRPPASPALAIYCHPLHFSEVDSSVDRASRPEAADPYRVIRETVVLPDLETDRAPGWIQASTRFMEQSTDRLLRRSNLAESDAPAVSGVQSAMMFVSDVLRRHAGKAWSMLPEYAEGGTPPTQGISAFGVDDASERE